MQNNRRQNSDIDETGEIISWIIIFIFMAAFFPVGLLLLIRKMRGYAKPSGSITGTIAGTTANTTQRAGAQTMKPASTKNKKRKKLEKKTGRFISTVFLLIAVALFIIGANVVADSVQNWLPLSIASVTGFVWGIFQFLGGFITLFARSLFTHRLGRYKKYSAFVCERDIVPLSDIAQTAGVSIRIVRREIQTMITTGYFNPGAYIDSELDCLVLSSKAAEEFRKSIIAEADILTQPDIPPENQYMAILSELREVNVTIADLTISGKVDRLEELTGKIFRIVEENPAKQPQIRRFMSYYLPTTMKLLRSYATLEKQGIKGENIMGAKENIGRILDTLVTGYEQQLDQLFKSDALDIAAEVNVLENLIQQDGLTGEKSEFKTMEGTT